MNPMGSAAFAYLDSPQPSMETALLRIETWPAKVAIGLIPKKTPALRSALLATGIGLIMDHASTAQKDMP